MVSTWSLRLARLTLASKIISRLIKCVHPRPSSPLAPLLTLASAPFLQHFPPPPQYHYIHHRDFEYNYAGLGSAFLDVWFGTFREAFKKSDDEKANSKQGLEQPADAKSDLTVMPTADFVLYLVAALGALGAWAYVACENRSLALKSPLGWAALAGFGPLIIAAIMGLGKQGGRKVFENGITAATIHLGFGVLFCCVPVTWAAYLAIV
jgi:hypothetical protein